MIGREGDEAGAEERVGARGEDFDVAGVGDGFGQLPAEAGAL